jgi:hypothetical protein
MQQQGFLLAVICGELFIDVVLVLRFSERGASRSSMPKPNELILPINAAKTVDILPAKEQA